MLVVDTNVLVSGLLSESGPPGRIVNLVVAGAITVIYDERILGEYDEVLRRHEFPFLDQDIRRLLAAIRRSGELVAGIPLPENLPDLSDESFLEVALAAAADCLITGNVGHYPKSRRAGMTVLSPAEFIEHYRRLLRRGL